jgi:hypothetical protein
MPTCALIRVTCNTAAHLLASHGAVSASSTSSSVVRSVNNSQQDVVKRTVSRMTLVAAVTGATVRVITVAKGAGRMESLRQSVDQSLDESSNNGLD